MGAILFNGGAAQTAIVDGFGDRGADGPDAAGPVKPFRNVGILKSGIGADGKSWIKGSGDDTDLGVGLDRKSVV